MNEKMELDVNLTIDEANMVLEALGKQPFNQVYQLISRIQQQAAAQLNGRQQDEFTSAAATIKKE